MILKNGKKIIFAIRQSTGKKREYEVYFYCYHNVSRHYWRKFLYLFPSVAPYSPLSGKQNPVGLFGHRPCGFSLSPYGAGASLSLWDLFRDVSDRVFVVNHHALPHSALFDFRHNRCHRRFATS